MAPAWLGAGGRGGSAGTWAGSTFAPCLLLEYDLEDERRQRVWFGQQELSEAALGYARWPFSAPFLHKDTGNRPQCCCRTMALTSVPPLAGCGEAGGRQRHPPRLVPLCFASAAGQASGLGSAPELSERGPAPPGADGPADPRLHARSRECSGARASCWGGGGGRAQPAGSSAGGTGAACPWPRGSAWGSGAPCRCSSPSAGSFLPFASACRDQPLLSPCGWNQGTGAGPRNAGELAGSGDTSGRGVALAGHQGAAEIGGSSSGLLALLFPQFSGASQLREAVLALIPAGVSNFCGREGGCEPRQLRGRCPWTRQGAAAKGLQSSAPSPWPC